MSVQGRRPLHFGQRIRHVGRLTQIVNVLARHGLASLLGRARILTGLSRETVREVEELAAASAARPTELVQDAARLRRAFEELGPAFVKLGQLLALREDILPKAYTEELRKLHSEVEAIPFEQIRKVLVAELGHERMAQLKELSSVPIAAGSIGQVHAAALADGRRIVVKVQRPGIEPAMRIDLSLMEMMAGLIEKHVPEARFARPRALIEEFARATLGELDFVREGANTAKIAANFVGQAHVCIPEVHWDMSTPRVLTLSFLEGQPFSRLAGSSTAGRDPKILLDRAVASFMKMVFQDGLYHGDLHPGNLLAMSNNAIAIVDFGVVIRLSRAVQEHLAGLLVALTKEDYDSVVAHFIEMTSPDSDFDTLAFGHELANTVAPFVGLSIREMRAGNLLWDLARIAVRHGAPMPRELILFLRNLVCLEGIAAQLDPRFDVIASCQKLTGDIVAAMYSPDYLKKEGLIIARDLAQLARHAPFQMRRILRSILDGDLRLNIASDDLARVASQFDRSTSRLAVSVILGSLIIASSILVFAKGSQLAVNVAVMGAVGYSVAGVLALYLLWSMFRGGDL